MSTDLRFLLPAAEATPDTVEYATQGGEFDTQEERGPQPAIPVRDPLNHGGIDIRTVRSPGIPINRHVDAEVQIAVSGDIGQSTMIWKRKHEVRWKGKSDFCNWAEPLNVRNSDTDWFHHPKLLAMSNGDLLCAWAENATSDATDTGWKWFTRVFDHRTYQFGPIIQLPNFVSGGVSVDRSAGDISVILLAESDITPGQIFAVGWGSPDNSGTSIYNLHTYTSHDFGKTWVLHHLTTSFDMAQGLTSGDMEVVRGRLVMVVASNDVTTNSVNGIYSNDNGRTWIVSDPKAFPGASPGTGRGGVTLTKTHNGALLCFAGNQTGASGDGLQVVYSIDGVTWTAFTDPLVNSPDSGADDAAHWPAAFVDDSGYLCLYWYGNNAVREGIMFMRSGIRDITLTEVQNTTNVFDDGTEEQRETLVLEDLLATRETGLIEFDAVNWRGRTVIITNYADTSNNGLVLYFANQWNDLRYETDNADQIPAWYYMFTPHAHPDQLGTTGYAWTLNGLKTNNYIAENGGYVIDDDGVNADSFTLSSPIAPDIVRVVCRVLVGGSVTGNDVSFAINHNADDTIIRCRLATTGFQFRDDNGTPADIASAITTDLTKWHEFIVVQSAGVLTQVYWRKIDPENDGEHVQYNTLLGASSVSLDTTVHASNGLFFGHAAVVNDTSEWRQVAVQATTGAAPSIYDPTNPFDAWDSSIAEQSTSDRPPELSEEPMHLTDGLAVSWVGSGALSRNRWDVETRADFPRTRILDGGSTTPWASTKASLAAAEYINIVLDAGENRKFHARSVALYGCNFPFVTIEMNDADYWVSPPVSIASVIQGSGSATAFRRMERIRDPAGVDFEVNADAIDGNTVKVSAAKLSTVDPLRPHAFRPRGTRSWYLVQATGTNTYVWKILDNSESRIYLNEAPGSAITVNDDLVVCSDRFLIDLLQHSITQDTVETGYRFLRLKIGHATNATLMRTPAEERFFKIGRLDVGMLESIASPEWGFTRRYVPNINLQTSLAGMVRSKRLGPELEQIKISWPALPGERPGDANWLQDKDVWQRVRDVIIATGMGLRSFSMVLDTFGLTDVTWRRVTGDDLVYGRFTGALDARMQSYISIEDCVTPLTQRIGTVMSVGGVMFTESP